MPKLSAELIKVFVYGTLKRGEPNHHWLTRNENGFAHFVGEGTTVERLPLVIGTRYNIPFLLDKRGLGHNIKGEIYEVDEKMFTNLDILEDYPVYYDREIQTITLNNNEQVQCWLYLIRKFPEKLLQKDYLTAYHNTKEQPYRESYLDSCKDDMYEDEEAPPKP
ncbi:putative gamma-glutamylcyclotransferase CG2811 isoform X2 [Lucilia cuprina]|uniref:putative gamma-glutamylcyclotransferase CG2811 isoform X1 n=1 Tax=Lucilia cuprina TaxID=7375 RepID=UPI001F05328E|nr:putative gamma-glutamylcyclotransferase CG2811 isoform X1 [Lucilia cuprina]XP_046810843.1 putative gamma-glutamylcyclotransferase CG2811 isoform X2 [Lucilia cuprina]